MSENSMQQDRFQPRPERCEVASCEGQGELDHARWREAEYRCISLYLHWRSPRFDRLALLESVARMNV
jgi:hypothetical protein